MMIQKFWFCLLYCVLMRARVAKERKARPSRPKFNHQLNCKAAKRKSMMTWTCRREGFYSLSTLPNPSIRRMICAVTVFSCTGAVFARLTSPLHRVIGFHSQHRHWFHRDLPPGWTPKQMFKNSLWLLKGA